MESYLKKLLLKEKFDSANVVALIEMIEEEDKYNINSIINILMEGCPKRNLNIDKIYNDVKRFTNYDKDNVITKFNKIVINELSDKIRVFFNKSKSHYEECYDLYNINSYCNE